MPRFSEENMGINLKLVDAISEIAARKGCTPGQLSLAWLTAQGPDVIPIPGKFKDFNINSPNFIFWISKIIFYKFFS